MLNDTSRAPTPARAPPRSRRRVEVNPAALHKYLTFSFVPGEDVPIRGIRRLLPGHVAEYSAGQLATRPYFRLREVPHAYVNADTKPFEADESVK